MPLSPAILWLIAGVVMLAAEAFGASGVGLMFAGLGALSVGGLIEFGFIAADDTLMHWVAFLLCSAVWTVILWKPMRRFYSSRSAQGYQNMIGDTAIIGPSGLAKGTPGEATWSGTIMKAELAPDAPAQKLAPGAQAEIVAVKGATLIVKPKN